ncbi:hypothetical protein Sango_1192000 [Sesamum angolense]|uniref:Retrotransposon gag domain-containing protein n=1 Tax=Sesamum angolense TaxID=2727404 RepID=A0AAE1WX44_9LAMI|nr:hypothetical protein Sango_1192000 [Sesamum angolense]
MAIVPERMINDMTSSDLNQQPLCIEYPDLEEFHVVCFGMRPQGITEEQIKLRAFLFSLADQAKDWLYFLPSGSITTWNDLKRQFLEKYFPVSRATTIRKEISEIHQFAGESLFEYWGRFNELVKSCPHHQIPDHLLIQYFYEGLSSMDRKLIDAASRGALFNKTPTEARNLISIMASNTQQFGTRYNDPPRKSNEVSIAAFDDRLNEFTSLVKKLAVERTQHVKACGICTSPEHVTDMCPTLQEPPTEHADAVGGFSGQQQRRYDPFSNTYNPGWKDHPNLSYGAQSQNFQRSQYRPPMPPPYNPKQECSAISTKHSNEYSEFESQMSQLASSVSKLESQDKNSTKRGHAQKRKLEKEVEIQRDQDEETKEDNPKVLVTRPPFLERFTISKKDEEAKEILETFRKVEVNIPLLDAIKQVPRYTRFLKELCTSKGKLKWNERGYVRFRSFINVMPLSIFESLHIGHLKEMGVVIQLANRSVVYPEGVLEDVLVQVNELVFPADFYVLDMREDNSPSSTSILLGRLFLKMARTKIDVHSDTLSMEFDGKITKFNIYDSMRYPSDIPTALLVDIVDPFVQALSSTNSEDHVKFVLEESLTPMLVQILEKITSRSPS